MPVEIRKARGPKVADLPSIPRNFVNPKSGLVDYWEVAEYEAALAKAEETGKPFEAPPLHQGSSIDVRECIANGSFMLPTEFPEKGKAAAEPEGEPGSEPSSEADIVPDMGKMTVAELKDLARDADIKGFSTMSKDQLLAALRED